MVSEAPVTPLAIAQAVLILVLVDNGFWALKYFYLRIKMQKVLILVLVDNGFWAFTQRANQIPEMS